MRKWGEHLLAEIFFLAWTAVIFWIVSNSEGHVIFQFDDPRLCEQGSIV